MITIRLFAAAREIVGKGEIEIPSEPGQTVASAWGRLCEGYPRLEGLAQTIHFALNQEYVACDTPLNDGDELALVPPVSGGEDLIAITEGEIDTGQVMQAVHSIACGAAVIFLGTAREWNEGKRVYHLEYEAYQDMALKMMHQIAQEIRRRWGVERVAIVHRVGRLELGEASVMIAVASPHRAEAFEACRYAIDRLKEIVPIWKREVREDGTFWGRQGG